MMTSGLLDTQVFYLDQLWVLAQSPLRARSPSVNWKSYLPIMRASFAKHWLCGVNGFGQSLVLLAGRENSVWFWRVQNLYFKTYFIWQPESNESDFICLSADLCLRIWNLQLNSSSEFYKTLFLSTPAFNPYDN